MTDPVLFWHAHFPVYGVFSQWYGHRFVMAPSAFLESIKTEVPVNVLALLVDLDKIDPDGDIIFTHAEQAMMFGKAIAMSDDGAAIDAMKATTPKEQKAVGRRVKNFDQQRWQAISLDLVSEISFWKFRDATLRDVLLGTENRIIAEASPYDRIWGIGLKPEDPRSKNPELWQGKNLLGKALMIARDRLKASTS